MLHHCGELVLRSKKKVEQHEESLNSDQSTESKPSAAVEKKEGSEEKQRREEPVSLAPDEDDDQVVCSVKPEEIPEGPSHKYLSRVSKVCPDEKETDRGGSGRKYDALGRKVIGRGNLRYSGKSRSRSSTPVLWRMALRERSRRMRGGRNGGGQENSGVGDNEEKQRDLSSPPRSGHQRSLNRLSQSKAVRNVSHDRDDDDF
ncbi:hypothetical protein ACOME3_006539 [Neoechinorhynchus agilis]